MEGEYTMLSDRAILCSKGGCNTIGDERWCVGVERKRPMLGSCKIIYL
jgi:hypothetical protein